MPENGFVPADLAVDGGGVRVEEQLRRVAPPPSRRLPRAAHPDPVTLARPDVGEEPVPDVGAALGQLHALLDAVAVEQAHLDRLGDLRRHRHVGPPLLRGSSQRERRALAQLHPLFLLAARRDTQLRAARKGMAV
jgi:hypothetical protein